MIIFAIDDEINSLDILTGAISEAAPDAEIRSFKRGDEAVKAAKDASCDVAFIDICTKDCSAALKTARVSLKE